METSTSHGIAFGLNAKVHMSVLPQNKLRCFFHSSFHELWIFHVAFEHMIEKHTWLSISVSLETSEQVRWCPSLPPNGTLFHRNLFCPFFVWGGALERSHYLPLSCGGRQERCKTLNFGWIGLTYYTGVPSLSAARSFFIVWGILCMVRSW